MRIENQNLGSVGGSSSSSSPSSVAAGGSRVGSQDREDYSSDVVKLSGASSLIAMAKGASSADRQSRIAGLAAQVRSGSYQASFQDVSKAIVGQLGA